MSGLLNQVLELMPLLLNQSSTMLLWKDCFLQSSLQHAIAHIVIKFILLL